MLKKVFITSIFFVCFLFLSSPVSAVTYYVSPTGSDENPGTAAQPFASFWQATSVLQPGDELKFYGGTYNQKLFTQKNGTATQPIKFSAVAGQKPIIDMQNNNDSGIHVNSQYVEISDIEVQNVKKITSEGPSGICVYVEGDNVTLNNLTIHHCYTHGILMFTKNITLTNSNVSYTNLVNQALQQGTQYGSAIKVAIGGENIRIEKNTVHHNYGEGIAVTRGKNVTVTNNVSYDNSPTNFYIDNSVNVTVDRNYSYCTGDPGFKKTDGTYPEGFSIGEEVYSGDWGSQLGNITVTNNIIDSCGSGILHWGSDFSTGGLRGALVAHNTIWNARFEGIHFNDAPDTDNVVVANNIIHTAASATRKGVFRNTTGTKVHHNFWVGGHSGNDENAVGTGDITATDAKLAVTPVLGSPQTLALSSLSPAINVGGALSPYNSDTPCGALVLCSLLTSDGTLKIDFTQANRDTSVDIGALEYSGVVSSPTPTATPSVNSCKPADINRDGIVDITDYSLLVIDFFKATPSNPRSDINVDGIVDITDYSLLVGQFLQTGSCQ